MTAAKKVIVAVDLANLYCQMKNFNDERETGDYEKLLSQFTKDGDQVNAMCFAPIPNPKDDIAGYSKTSKLHNMLRYLGFMIYSTERKNGKADIDVLLTVKAMEVCYASNPDEFILVSADGDFEPLIMSLRERGIIVTVASIEAHMSNKLQMAANNVVDLSEWSANIKKKKDKGIPTIDTKIVEEVMKKIYELDKVFDEVDRRRINIRIVLEQMTNSTKSFSIKGLTSHKLIINTLKQCMSDIPPDELTRDDLNFIKSIMEMLKKPRVNPDVVKDIRIKLLGG